MIPVSDLSIEDQLKREDAQERARFAATSADRVALPKNGLAASTHRRQDRRSSDEDAPQRRVRTDTVTSPVLPTYVRFPDLVQARIVANWIGLRRLIINQGFPTGTMLGPKTRAWLLSEVQAWLDTRPVANPRKRMRHKRAIVEEVAEDPE